MTYIQTNSVVSRLIYPLCKLKHSIDYFSLNDWKRIEEHPFNDQTTIIMDSEDPLTKELGDQILSIWLFQVTTVENAPKITPISFHITNYFRTEFNCKLENLNNIKQNFAQIFINMCEIFPNSFSKNDFFSSPPIQALVNAKFIKSCGVNFILIRSSCNKYACYVLYRSQIKEKNKDNDEAASETRLLQLISSRIFDYLHIHSKLSVNIPWKSIFDLIQKNPQRAIEFYHNQKSYNPLSCEPFKGFLWPWQRCISMMDKELQHSSIRTVSLVGDIRHSTVAMSEFKPAEEYANFLDEIIHTSRKICLDNDAYFDKETGDGFVVHFCGTEAGDIPTKTDSYYISRQAIKVGIKLLNMTQNVINEYQEKLGIELDGLGLSIGIHMDDATWLCNQNQIRAIGPSVVRAARLCDAACSNEILVTPPVYRAYTKSDSPTKFRCFERVNRDIKEIPPEAIPMVYSLKLKGSEK